jgi:hypothetical protein
MKACDFWMEKVKAAACDISRRRIIREIQADALNGAAHFAFNEREFALASHLGAAADTLLTQGGDPTPVKDQAHTSPEK